MLVWRVFSIYLKFVIIVSFSYVYISQGSVEIQLWCGVSAECAGEKILKIDQ